MFLLKGRMLLMELAIKDNWRSKKLSKTKNNNLRKQYYFQENFNFQLGNYSQPYLDAYLDRP
jgi:hypothetical protein